MMGPVDETQGASLPESATSFRAASRRLTVYCLKSHDELAALPANNLLVALATASCCQERTHGKEAVPRGDRRLAPQWLCWHER